MEKKYTGRIEFIYPERMAFRMFHDFARNAIVEEFLASEADILWQLDSDIEPPLNALDIVADHHEKWQAAGCPYPVLVGSAKENKTRDLVWTIYKGTAAGGLVPGDIPMSGLDFVDGVATGCMFVKRGVFMRLAKPYFEFKYDAETRQMTEGEDLGFCLKLKALGIPFFVDYSLVCEHVKRVGLLEMNNYAMQYAKRSVEAYSAQVREELKQHALRSKAAASQPKLWTPRD